MSGEPCASYCSLIAARVFSHGVLERIAAAVDVPVVNLLSDVAHPCQALADLLTLRELFGSIEGRRLVYVGDGNNVAASLAFGAALTGLELTVASPSGYELDDTLVDRARNLGGVIDLVGDPHEAVKGADAVYADVWTSMGDEHEAEVRREAFAGWQVDTDLMAIAGPGRVLPALPAGPPRRGGQRRGARRTQERDLAAGGEPDARSPGVVPAHCRGGALMATLGKPQRQHRLARLLEEQVISSQSQIVELMGAEGVLATQATVSRDLEELGAVKVRIPGGAMAYAIPEHSKDHAPPEDHLHRVMGEFVVEVSHSGNLALLRTSPGSAHVIGSALDRAGFPDMLGNVCGDDTIIVVCAEATGGGPVAAKLAELAGL